METKRFWELYRAMRIAMPMLGMQALRNGDLLGVATRPEVK